MNKNLSKLAGRYGRLVSLLFTITFVSNVVAQNAGKNILESFDNCRQRYLQEKIFVHTDKAVYIAGEVCWFKLYNVDAYLHKLSGVSKVAYVEVLDTTNHSVLQAKIVLNKGTGNGSFLIPANVASGNYVLRAYTNLMKNTGADFFYEKVVSIINPNKTDWQSAPPRNNNFEISFFPEGGNLLTGIENRVGFKMNDRYGRGVEGKGVLLNDKGDTVLRFQPFQFGIGSFNFTPQADTKYTAYVLVPGASQQQKELPKSYTSGYSLRLDEKDAATVQVTISSAGIAEQAQVFLFVHTRNLIKVAETGTLKNGQLIFDVDKSKLGDGISHFTVFDQHNQPVCERIFFKKPAKQLLIEPVTDRDYYQQRKKITVDISSTITDSKSTSANLSVAVYQVDSLSMLDEASITSYLLLNADLKGSIESPGWYFDNDNDSTKRALDNLMLTHGWRRFNWQDVLSDKKPVMKFLPELNGHLVTAKLTGTEGSVLPASITGYLSAPGTLTQFKNAQIGADGIAYFEMKDFYTNGFLVAQTNYLYDSSYQLNIESPFSQLPALKKPAPYLISNKQEALLQYYISSQVQNTYLSGKLNTFSDPNVDTTSFYNRANDFYLLDNYVRFATIEEVLKEYVPSVLVRRSGTKFTLPIIDLGTKNILPGSPLLLIDGVPIFDFDNFMLYDAQKYRKLEIVDRRFISGSFVHNGILNFTSYNGDVGGFQLNPHAVMIDYEGLQLQREFYSPTYETPEKTASRLPDFRTTLFWSPNLHTDTNGKAQLIFYSSDLPGKYAMVIQGIAADGTTGKSVVFFRVTQP